MSQCSPASVPEQHSPGSILPNSRVGNAALGPHGVHLGDGDGAETRLPTVGEVTGDLDGV